MNGIVVVYNIADVDSICGNNTDGYCCLKDALNATASSCVCSPGKTFKVKAGDAMTTITPSPSGPAVSNGDVYLGLRDFLIISLFLFPFLFVFVLKHIPDSDNCANRSSTTVQRIRKFWRWDRRPRRHRCSCSSWILSLAQTPSLP